MTEPSTGAPHDDVARRARRPEAMKIEVLYFIDGADVEPGAAERSDFGLKCRLFRTPEGSSPTPPDDWLRAAPERRRDRLMR